MVQHTFDHGLSKYSSIGFCSLGSVLCALKGDKSGYQYGIIGLALLKKHKSKEFLPTVYNLFYACISPFHAPINDVFRPLLKSQRIGRKFYLYTYSYRDVLN